MWRRHISCVPLAVISPVAAALRAKQYSAAKQVEGVAELPEQLACMQLACMHNNTAYVVHA